MKLISRYRSEKPW